MIRYLDTSAALKLLIAEPDTSALVDALSDSNHTLVGGMLLVTELHCAADRRAALDPESVNAILDGIDLLDITRADLLRAGTSRWGLRSADAIHLAVALRAEVDQLITYDHELAVVAVGAGLQVLSPA